MFNKSIFECADMIIAVTPQNLAAGPQNGEWADVRNFSRLGIVLVKGAGAVGEDPELTVRQAKDAAGTDAKALNITRVYEKVGAAAKGGKWTARKMDAASSAYSNDASGEAAAIFGLDIKTSSLDDGFTHVQVQVSDPGNTAQTGGVIYIGMGARYLGDNLPRL